METIKWRKGSDKLIFGEVGRFTLFYIKDNNPGGGLFRYQLEVKFSDERWTSNSLKELKDTAEKQLEVLRQNI